MRCPNVAFIGELLIAGREALQRRQAGGRLEESSAEMFSSAMRSCALVIQRKGGAARRERRVLENDAFYSELLVIWLLTKLHVDKDNDKCVCCRL